MQKMYFLRFICILLSSCKKTDIQHKHIYIYIYILKESISVFLFSVLWFTRIMIAMKKNLNTPTQDVKKSDSKPLAEAKIF